MSVTGTPVVVETIVTNYILSEFIDKILEDVGSAIDGTGFWSRTDVLKATDCIQREISRETKNILAVTATIEPAASATEITIDANNNFLGGVSAYRTYGGLTRPIDFFTQEQMRNYSVSWKTQTGSQIRALITDIASADGNALIWPIPDNADNDIIVYYKKLASRLTNEYSEAGDVSAQLSGWKFYGVNEDNTNNGLLYWSLTNVTSTRTVDLYKSTSKTAANKVATGSRSGDGTITLTASNSSGLTGSVVVAFTVDDTDAANIITLTGIEIPEADVPCLEYGVKAHMYNLEKDGKDKDKGNFWKGLYGGRDAKSGILTGELAAVARRARQRREGTFGTMQERPGADSLKRTRPFYSWEA